jgi:hypothetical protein
MRNLGLIKLILSLDYEIFGNGAGDVMRDIIEPTDRLLDICDSHGAKLTIMFEAAEYWAFKQMEEKLDLGYSPAKAMETQARDAISRGHDVQLHLHPQWIGAELDNRIWRVRTDQWCIANLPHGLGNNADEYSIAGALSKGKRTLESMLRPVRPVYECIAFRAGGFHIQPSWRVISAMKAVGLWIDSSVVKGLYVRSPDWPCDFRTAVSNYGYWWTTEDDLCRSGPEQEHILELPVYSKMQPYAANFRWSKLRTELKRRKLESRYPGTIKQAGGIRSTHKLSQVLLKMVSVQPVLVDFCKLNARSMVRAIEEIMLTNTFTDGQTEQAVPVVLIGHSKDFWNDGQLGSFLSTMKSSSLYKEKIQFRTFSDAADELVGARRLHALNIEVDGAAPATVKSTDIKDNTGIV